MIKGIIDYMYEEERRHFEEFDATPENHIFLKINRYDLLNNPGEISHDMAIRKAESEYSKFRRIQDQKFISDFDEVNKIKKKK